MTKAIKIGAAVFLVMTLLSAISYVVFSRSYFLVTVSGESMTPTFKSGDRIVFSKVDKPVTGDYVVFKLPEEWKTAWLGNDADSLIKRVRLLPGDTLAWDGLAWYRNGEEFSSVTKGSCDQAPLEKVLDEGEYFVTGDTTDSKTLDSREAFCRGIPYFVPASKVEYFGKVKKIL